MASQSRSFFKSVVFYFSVYMYAVLCRYIKFTFYRLSFTMDKRATKRKQVVLTIEDKQKVCRLAKQNVLNLY